MNEKVVDQWALQLLSLHQVQHHLAPQSTNNSILAEMMMTMGGGITGMVVGQFDDEDDAGEGTAVDAFLDLLVADAGGGSCQRFCVGASPSVSLAPARPRPQQRRGRGLLHGRLLLLAKRPFAPVDVPRPPPPPLLRLLLCLDAFLLLCLSYFQSII